MTHLVNVKQATEDNIQQLIRSGYTTNDLATYYEHVDRHSRELIRRINKAFELTVISTQTGLALIAATHANYILTNTDNILADVDMLETIGADKIKNASHLRLVVTSIASRADQIWGQSSIWNHFKYAVLKQRPHMSKVEEFYKLPETDEPIANAA